MTRLYKKDSKGTTRFWEILITRGIHLSIQKRYGTLGGKAQTRIEEIRKGKANRTVMEQAELQMRSAIKKQRDKGYHEAGEEYEGPTLPMLAHTYDPKKVKYPCVVQEKLNGIRCVAKKTDSKTILYTSRTGQTFHNLGHITPYLLPLMDLGQEWDGEIFCPGMALQKISSAVKKVNENTQNLQYWVYDRIVMDISFSLRRLDGLPTKGVVFLQSHRVDYEPQLDALYKQMVARGAEGCIVRNLDGLYKNGRSWDLMKRKDFTDEEFEIVDWTRDVDNCVIWICVTKNGHPFHVVPTGTKESRRISSIQADASINLMLTVRFSEKSTGGIPQGNPVGVAIRDYE